MPRPCWGLVVTGRSSRSRRRDAWRGLQLGLLGLALGLLPLRLLGPGVPPLLFGQVPVLLAFVVLGVGPGWLAALVSQAVWLIPGTEVGPALALAAPEAFVVAWLFRRWGSVVFSFSVYFCSVGWLAVVLLEGSGWSAAPAVAGQALGGLLAAAATDAILLWLTQPHEAGETRPAADLERFLSRPAALVVVVPACLLALIAVRALVAPRPEGLDSGSWLQLALSSVLLLTFGVVFLSRASLGRVARQVAAPLRAVDQALAEAERGEGDGTLPPALARHPVAELRRLAARLAGFSRGGAYHDPLTGLPNRKLMLDRLELAVAQARRTDEGVALLHVDLDRFRAIDDSLGRALADAVLQQIVGRLHECVRAGDTVARVGDDEFALIMPRLGSMDEAVQTAQRVMDNVKRALNIDSREVFLTASVGISLFPRDGNDAETLLKNANAATRVAKQGGQDTYRRYTARISAKDARRLIVETAVRGALSRNEMVLHYQPVVALANGRIEGLEALVRCPASDGALLPPADFIPVAEASDLIVEVGQWVLAAAGGQTRAWRDKGHDLTLAVNLSARQFQQPDVVSQVLRTLQTAGLEPASLELEITESVALQDVDRSVGTLKALRAEGIRIALDDFGTGYSSLSYLRRLPVDTVKLDQSFVAEARPGTNDAAIAVAIITLAHGLGLRVVAEGVETHEQLDFLREQGCDALQGYLLSPPAAAADFEALLGQPLQPART